MELTEAPQKLFDNGGDFACGNALDIHFGQRELERLLAADALVQSAGIEGDPASDLRHGEGNGTNARIDGFGFETVGVAGASVGALIGLGLEDLGAFLRHSFVDEQTNAMG